MRTVVPRTFVILSLCLLLGVGGLAVSQDLPPEMRADQYLMEGKRALEHKDPAAAVEAFKKVEALPVDPPAEFVYWDGEQQAVHKISLNNVIAIHNGEGFLQRDLRETGRESAHYTSALEWISRVEGKRLPWLQLPANEPGPSAGQPAIPEVSPHVIKIAQQTKLDQCDNNLWGEWNCSNISVILSHSFDANGVEQVLVDREVGLFTRDKQSYPVDRKWHSNAQTGKTNVVTCGGWNDYGFRVMSILTRDAPGQRSAKYVRYYVNHENVLWVKFGEIHKDQNGKVTSTEHNKMSCERETSLF